MDKIRLGSTGLMVTAVSFGALPVQRCSVEDGVRLIREAYDLGINYFDTANAYSDSEKKLGLALSDVRDKVIISTKTGALTKAKATEHIENSLRMLKTDYIDVLQLHNPKQLPDPDDPDGPYAAALEAKQKGWVRHIGITNHSRDNAIAAVNSGKYETLMYPFSYLSSDEELQLPALCAQKDVGFIAMKGMCGGMLRSPRAASAFAREFGNVVPIWGVQKSEELREWVQLYEEGVKMDEELREIIRRERVELAGEFCRSCGYCLPCTVGIDIPQAARMRMLLRRAPYKGFFTPERYENMQLINDCVECGQCASRCPYGLDTPGLLKIMLKDYNEFYEEHKEELEPLVKGR